MHQVSRVETDVCVPLTSGIDHAPTFETRTRQRMVVRH